MRSDRHHPREVSQISVLHTWANILTVAGGVLSVLLAVPGFRFGGVWRTCLKIAAFVLILGLSMLLEEQILNSAGVSENGSSDNHRQSERSTNAHKDGPTPECRSGVVKLLFLAMHSPLSFYRL